MAPVSADVLQTSQRLVATHPGCPLSVRHDGAWKLQNYKVEATLPISGDADHETARCSRCGTAVQMLVYNMEKLSIEELDSKQKLILRSCGIQHPYLHLPWAAFEDSGSFCILYGVMDQGNLEQEIAQAGGKLTERQAVQKVVQPCLTALADLHAKTLTHGAIVPQNILFSSQQPTCKLAGLFLPSEVSTAEAESALQRIAAPEQDATSIGSAVQSASAASDMFMLGAVTYEMLVGNPAFGAKDDCLGRAKKWQDPEMPLWLSDHAQDFLSKLLVKDSAKRSAAAQLLKHPWLKSLGFKPSADQVPSSVVVVEPVLPSRPVVAAEVKAEAVVVTEPVVAEEQIVEEETIKAVVPEEVAAPAAVVVSEPSPLNRSGKKHSISKPAEALETGWDLFYKSGSGSSSKAKPKPKVVVPKVGKAASGSRRGSVATSNREGSDAK